jgi:hypothetical protein
MTDALQVLLAAVITSLTVVLIIIGIEFYFILKEVKKSIIKMNNIVDDTHTVTRVIATATEEASGFVAGLKKGAGLLKVIKKLTSDEEKD